MDLILTAHKMRIYPNDEQIQIIETTFGAARRMFNSLHAQFEERSKLTNAITNKSQVIIAESLNVKGMVKNKKLAKHISDASWGVQIDTFFPSSKMCSNCKEIHELTNDLSVREWQCPTCNSIHDRDINAAINILNEGLTLI